MQVDERTLDDLLYVSHFLGIPGLISKTFKVLRDLRYNYNVEEWNEETDSSSEIEDEEDIDR